MIEPNVTGIFYGVSANAADSSVLIYFSWAYLANILGAGVMASIIVRVIDTIAGKAPTASSWLSRLSTLLLSTGILTVATYFDSGSLTLEKFALCLLNGFGAYLVATGGYDNLLKIINKARGGAA